MTLNTDDHWRNLEAAEIQRRLQLSDDIMARLSRMAASPTPDMHLPSDETADALLRKLGAEPSDRDSTIAARPDEHNHPELWWVLNRSCRVLLTQMGQRRPGNPGWGPLPDGSGEVGHHLFVWAFLAVLPHVRDYHASIGLTDEESWSSLSALSDELKSSRLLTGTNGLDASWGLPMVFSGVSFRLGRLAFDRQRPQPHDTDHVHLRAGESGLNTHIPGGYGPLTRTACDASFQRAIEVTQQFPEQVVAFGCHSWLMDTQLTSYLPSGRTLSSSSAASRISVIDRKPTGKLSGISFIDGTTGQTGQTSRPGSLMAFHNTRRWNELSYHTYAEAVIGTTKPVGYGWTP